MSKRGRPPHPDILTPREWEVLALLRERLTNREIAARLGISVHAARYHVSEILSKLGVGTREKAAAWRPGEPRQRRRGWWAAWPLAALFGRAAAGATALAVVAAFGVIAWALLS